MNYKQALKHALKVKWKVSLCNEGKSCWCRIIEPMEDIKHDDNDGIYITKSGSINKEHAEYIVKLHNDNLKQ